MLDSTDLIAFKWSGMGFIGFNNSEFIAIDSLFDWKGLGLGIGFIWIDHNNNNNKWLNRLIFLRYWMVNVENDVIAGGLEKEVDNG